MDAASATRVIEVTFIFVSFRDFGKKAFCQGFDQENQT